MPNFETIAACIGAFLVLIIVALSIWLFVDGNRIDALKVENAQYEAANTELKTAIDKQTIAVKAYETASAELAARAAKALADAQKNAVTLDAAIASLKNAKAGSDVCKSADALFNPYIARKK